jgi:hypothetical protein
MKVWTKAIIIFVGCGLSAVLTYGTTLLPVWATVFGGLQIADLATVAILTGFKTTV